VGRRVYKRTHRSVTFEDRIRQAVLARDKYQCHICQCPVTDFTNLRSMDADHIIPKVEGGRFTMENLKAAHGAKSRCPHCGTCCNSVRLGCSIERVRRIIEERSGCAHWRGVCKKCGPLGQPKPPAGRALW
jgi:hypothetical protein